MSRLHRARKALQELLAEHAESLGLRPAAEATAGRTDAAKTISLDSYRRERSHG
jgi:hypothetical protein